MSQAHRVLYELMAFVENGAVGPSVAPAVSRLGKQALRLLAIKVLSWLKWQAKRHAMSQEVVPLSEGHEVSWFKTLQHLIAEDDAFRQLLVVDDGAVRLHPALSRAEVSELLRECAAGYNPKLRT